MSVDPHKLADWRMPESKPASIQSRHNRAAIYFLLPAVLVFSLYVLYPIVQSLWLAFHDWDGLPTTQAKWVGLGNFVEALNSDTFWLALENNVIWLLLYMLSPVFGLAIALYLNQKIRGMRLAKALFFFPFVISPVVVGLVFSWFYNPQYGIISLFSDSGMAVLEDENTATFAVILAALWPQTAYCMILYLTGLNNVSPDQIEAARLDGASGWNMLTRIILPQLAPATFIAVVVTVIGALRSFDLIAIMTQGGPAESTTVLAYFMYEQQANFRIGYSSAIATILFLIMMVYIVFFLSKMLKDEQ
ncbi:MAG: carbohydrate ABC transporter permease [Formosimonas sp.]